MFQQICTMWFDCFLVIVILTTKTESSDKHMNTGKRFGEGFPYLNVKEVQKFPDNAEFINEHVIKQQPLLIRGGAKISPAFKLWNDDYFLSLTIPDDNEILAETVKKEDRNQETKMLHFQEFVRVYNDSELYMVESIPKFLKADIMIPCPLRCRGISIVESIMWYSSGGTKSVLHTDSVDNLNCLYRGRKSVIFIDRKYADFVDLDHPEGSYSSVDVDNVDYEKFPGLAEVEYYNISMTAGDCLFIPYLWYHQIRSFGHNIAVNMWWDHHSAVDLDVDECSKLQCDEDKTLGDVEMTSFNQLTTTHGVIMDRILAIIGVSKYTTPDLFIKGFFKMDDLPPEVDEIKREIETSLQEIFALVDQNKDGELTKAEVREHDDWTWILEQIQHFEDLMNDEGDEGLDRDEEHSETDVDSANMMDGIIVEGDGVAKDEL